MTLENLLALNPCDPERLISMFAGRKSMNITQAFESGATVSDICWLMGKLKRLDDIVSFANFCADQARVDATAARYYDRADAAARAARAAAAADDAARAAARAARAAADAYADPADAYIAQKVFLINLLSE